MENLILWLMTLLYIMHNMSVNNYYCGLCEEQKFPILQYYVILLSFQPEFVISSVATSLFPLHIGRVYVPILQRKIK